MQQQQQGQAPKPREHATGRSDGRGRDEGGIFLAQRPAENTKGHNRLHVVLAHTTRYAFEPKARLAKDVGVSRSTISRLMSGKSRSSFDLVQRVTRALEQALGYCSLDPRELFSPDGTYPTVSGCLLCGCNGCMPEEAYDRWGRLRPAFQAMKPGDWSLSPPGPAPDGAGSTVQTVQAATLLLP